MRPVDVRLSEIDAGFDFDFGLLLALGFGLTVLAVLSTSRASECPETSAEYVTGDPLGNASGRRDPGVERAQESLASPSVFQLHLRRRVRRQDHDDRQRFSIVASPAGNRGPN